MESSAVDTPVHGRGGVGRAPLVPRCGGLRHPQVLAAMEPGQTPQERRRVVSLSMSLAKILDTASSLMAAIVLAGLMGVSVYGNNAYFGVIQVPSLSWSLFLPGLLVALLSGLAGDLFSRLLIRSLTGVGTDRFSQWRRHFPIRFAAGCGFVVAVIGVLSQGATLGSGYQPTRQLLEGHDTTSAPCVPLRFISSWLSAWSGAPGTSSRLAWPSVPASVAMSPPGRAIPQLLP